MKLLVIGDWEGDVPEIAPVLDLARREHADRVVQLGDLGWRGRDPIAAATLAELERRLAALDLVVYFLDGNHDQITACELAAAEPTFDGVGVCLLRLDGAGHHRFLRFLRRGERWTWDGVRFCALGGADSTIERLMGAHTVDSAPITEEHVQAAHEGGPVEVLLSHESAIVDRDTLKRLFSVTRDHPAASAYRSQLRRVIDETRPRVHVHAHHHRRADYMISLADTAKVEVTCLDEVLSGAAGWLLLDTAGLAR